MTNSEDEDDEEEAFEKGNQHYFADGYSSDIFPSPVNSESAKNVQMQDRVVIAKEINISQRRK